MKARRRLITGAIACALALGGSALVANPASAAASWCPANKYCLFFHTGYTGFMLERNYSTDLRNLYTDVAASYNWNDKASSIVNNRSVWMDAFEHTNYGGYKLRLTSGQVRSDLRYSYMPNGWNWNDRISSFW